MSLRVGVGIVLFCMVHAGLRLAGPDTLIPDEAEHALYAQNWELGYRPRNPPLTSWVAHAFHEAGLSLRLAIITMKYLGLGLGLFAFYAAARALLRDEGRAAIALTALSATVLFGFHLHDTYTHTVWAIAAAAGLLWTGARMVETRRLADYALFGLVGAAGFLAKYNGLAVIALTLGALALVPATRRGLRPAGLALAAGVFAVLCAAPIWWFVTEGVSLTGLYVYVSTEGVDPANTVFTGLQDMALAALGMPLPGLLVVLALWPQALRLSADAPPSDRRARHVGLAVLALALIGLAAVVVLAGSTSFRDRWLAPLLIIWPIALMAAVPIGMLTARRMHVFFAVSLALILVGAVARPIKSVVYPHQCGGCEAFAPYAALTEQARAQGLLQGTVLGLDETILGNLRAFAPDVPAIALNHPESVYPPPRAPLALFWDADVMEEGAPPAPLPAPLARAFAERFGEPPQLGQSGTLSAPLLGAPARTYRVHFARVTQAGEAK